MTFLDAVQGSLALFRLKCGRGHASERERPESRRKLGNGLALATLRSRSTLNDSATLTVVAILGGRGVYHLFLGLSVANFLATARDFVTGYIMSKKSLLI